MEAKEKAADFIKDFEGFSAEAYPDPLLGWSLPTIGYGTTIYPDGTHVKQGDIVDEGYALECLAYWIAVKCEMGLTEIPLWYSMNENQQAALYSFAYNLGPWFYGKKNFKSISQLCVSPNLWDEYTYVESVFVKYRNPGSNVEAGLKRRRIAEAKLFCTPVEV